MQFSRSVLLHLLFLFLSGWLLAAAPPPNAPQPRFGVHLSTPDDDSLRFAAENGFDHVVVVFSWRDIEPVQGAYFWERYDNMVRDAEVLGVELLVRLDQTPAWAADPAADPTALQALPSQDALYAQFVERVVTRYTGQVKGYILWNEPNLAEEWGNLPPNPRRFAALFQQGAAAVRRADPNALLFAPGLAATNQNDAKAMDERLFLRGLYEAGIGGTFDVLAVHPYGFGAAPGTPYTQNELNFRRIEAQRAITEEFGDSDIPMWATEFGWTVQATRPDQTWQEVSVTAQADYTQQAIEWAAQEYPWLQGLTLWWLGPKEDGYSLIGTEGIRPLVAAVRRPALTPMAGSRETIPLIAEDVWIRLGDRGVLRPHWFYMHNNQPEALVWQTEFELTTVEVHSMTTLNLSMMHIDHIMDELYLNGAYFGTLPRRANPDPSSHWVAYSFPIPAGQLRVGQNTLELRSSRRLVRHYGYNWRFDNLQIRNVTLSQNADTLESISSVGTLRQIETPGEGRREVTFLAPSEQGMVVGYYAPGVLGFSRDGVIWEAVTLPDNATPLAGTWFEGAWWVGSSKGMWRSEDGTQWERVESPLQWVNAVAVFQGKLWAASAEGLFEWGGDGWQKSPLERWVLSLRVMPDGRFFVGTVDGLWQTLDGIAWERLPVRRDGEVDFYPVLHTLPDGTLWANRVWDGQTWRDPEPLLNLVTATYADTDGIWWAATFDGSLHRWAKGQWESPFVSTDVMNQLGQMVRWQGKLWGGSSWGLVEIDPQTGQPTTIALSNQPPMITSLHQDGDTIWYGTPKGAWRSVNDGQAWTQQLSYHWIYALNGRENGIWAGTRDGVMVSTDAGEHFALNEGLQALTYVVTPDLRENEIALAGTWGYNLLTSADGTTFDSIHNGLETLSVLSLWQNPSAPAEIWVGTVEGIYRTENNGQSWMYVANGPCGSVFNLYGTKAGQLLAATGEGLWQTDIQTRHWLVFQPDTAWMSIAGYKGYLVAGTEWGELWISDDAGQTWVRRGEGLGAIYAMVQGDKGVYLGGENGLWVWELGNGRALKKR